MEGGGEADETQVLEKETLVSTRDVSYTRSPEAEELFNALLVVQRVSAEQSLSHTHTGTHILFFSG